MPGLSAFRAISSVQNAPLGTNNGRRVTSPGQSLAAVPPAHPFLLMSPQGEVVDWQPYKVISFINPYKAFAGSLLPVLRVTLSCSLFELLQYSFLGFCKKLPARITFLQEQKQMHSNKFPISKQAVSQVWASPSPHSHGCHDSLSAA